MENEGDRIVDGERGDSFYCDGVVDYTDVSTVSEQATMLAVAQQPVSIAIEANQYSFPSYSSDVFTG